MERKTVERRNLTLIPSTLSKRIAREARRTAADGVMVDDLAPGVDATGARAGIGTLLVDTRTVLRTVGTDQALRPARGRSTDVVGLARAHGVTINRPAQTVRAARRWLARVHRGYWCGYRHNTCYMQVQGTERKQSTVKEKYNVRSQDVT